MPVPAPASSPVPLQAPPTAGIGQPVRDGKFEFTVLGLECGAQRVGGQYFGQEAQGQFCLMNLRVSNVGERPQHLFTANQRAFDAQGREFSADDAATIFHDVGTDVWSSEINPGNTVEGVVVFDVPADTQLVRGELHDSAFSGGVEVRLAG